MNILLAKPIIEKEKRVNAVPPLGLGYLASALRKDNDVSVVDCELLGYDAEAFARHIRREQPGLIGMTVFSHNKKCVQESISVIRNAVPEAIIVLGGPHINARGANVLKGFSGVDYAVRGEAEESIVLLADIIKNRKYDQLGKVPGLVYMDREGRINETPNVFLDDISRFDPIPYDLLNIRDYFGRVPHGFFCRHKELVSIITSRGCPYPCTFCSGAVNNGKKVRYRRLENVMAEIELLAGKYGVREIHIIDDNFTFSKEYALKFCEEVISRKFSLDFALPNGIRLDKIDDELLATMRRAGFYAISFGIESGSDETLRKIKKLETTDFVMKQVTLAKKHGFLITGLFIIGFPWETKDDVETTLRFAKSLPLDHASFGNFVPLPATEITEDLIKAGELPEDYEVPFIWGDITYSPPGIRADELKKLQRRCVFEFYFPGRIHMLLANIKLSNIMHLFRRALLLFVGK